MLISRIPHRLPYWHADQKTRMLIGCSGIGKTAMLLAAPDIIFKATGKRIGVVVFNAFTYTPMHMMGFGVVKHHQNHSEMLFSDPFFWTTSDGKRLEDYYDGGFILVDEADKGEPDLMKIVIEMGNSGRVGTHRLPPNWCMLMAANPHDARYGSKKLLDYQINRMLPINVRSDPDAWTDWGVRVGLLPNTLAFASDTEQRALVFADKLPEKQGPWCNPRSLHALDHIIQTEMRIDSTTTIPEHPDILEEAEAAVGYGAAEAYFRKLKMSTGMPSVAQVVGDPLKTPLPSPDCCHLFCYNAAFAATNANIPNLIKYVDRLPKEYAMTFMRAAINKNSKLIVNKDVGAWAQKNAQLLMLLNKYAHRGSALIGQLATAVLTICFVLLIMAVFAIILAD